MDLSIVVVNYNAADQLKRCLSSIYANAEGVALEAIVVDNASSDGSADMVAARFPQARLIRNTANLGYTRANNAGIAAARGELVLLLNNDTEILPGALAGLVAFLREHASVGAAAPRLLNGDLTLQASVRSFATALTPLLGRRSPLTRLFPGNRFSRRYLLHVDRDLARPSEVDVASTACLMVRKRALEEIGGFDTDFFCYWSDADLCARLKKLGWGVVWVPTLRVVHDEHNGGARSDAPRSRRSIVDFHRGAYLYYVKDRLRFRFSLMRLAALAGLSLACALELLLAALRPLAAARSRFVNPARSPAAAAVIRALAAAAVLLLAVLLALNLRAVAGTLLPPPLRPAPGTSAASAEASWTAGEPPGAGETSETSFFVPTGLPWRSSPVLVEAAPYAEPRLPALGDPFATASVAHAVGMTAYLLDEPDRVETRIAALKELGVKSVRMDFRWDIIEPERGRWEFDRLDHAVRRLGENGIDVLAVLCFTAPWASSGPAGAPYDERVSWPPADISDYERFVTTVVSRYPGISRWQVGTEPDLDTFWYPEPDPVAFARHFKTGARAVKRENPSATVVFPGLTSPGKLGFLEKALGEGVADFADVFAYHNYSQTAEGVLREEVACFVDLVRRGCPEPKECWFTEMGWSTYDASLVRPDERNIPAVDERTQGENLVKRLVLANELPLARTFVWELSDAGTDAGALLFHLGLMRWDLSRKSAFANVAAVMPLVGDGRSVPPILVTASPSSEALEVHVTEGGGGSLGVAVWTRGTSRVSVRLATDDYAQPVEVGLDDGATTPVGETAARGGVELAPLTASVRPRLFTLSRPRLYNTPSAFTTRAGTSVAFGLEHAAPVSLRVLDARGHLVRSLVEGEACAAGAHIVRWDARDDRGARVPDGTYTAELEAGGETLRNAMAVDGRAPEVTAIDTRQAVEVPEGDDMPFLFVPVTFRLSEPAKVALDVFDDAGRPYSHVEVPAMQPAGEARAEWTVPASDIHEGVYWVRVTATDAAGNARTATAATPLRLDLTAPGLGKAGWETAAFSPNGDGRLDTDVFGYSLSEAANVVACVRDSLGRERYLFVDTGEAPGRYEYAWDGRAYDPATDALEWMPDGTYELELTAIDWSGNQATARAKVTIAGSAEWSPGYTRTVTVVAPSPPPSCWGDVRRVRFTEIERSAADGGGRAMRVDYELARDSSAILAVRNLAGEVFYVATFANAARGEHSFVWDGQAFDPETRTQVRLPDGTYAYWLDARTPKGSAGGATGGVNVRVGGGG